MSLLIRNGRIIDPEQSIDRLGAVLIVDGRIVRMGEGSMSAHTVIDAKGMIVCPGFIDLHCHLRQPGFEEKETIASGTRAAARGGFTTVCCMPNTLPPIATPAIVEQVQKIAAIEGAVRVLPISAVTEDRNGRKMADLSDLHAAGAVAFSDDGSPVADSLIMRQALEQSRILGLPIIDHCEDTDISRDGSMNEGKTSDRLGLRGIPAAAEELVVERDIQLARETGGRLHIAHVSTARSVAIIREAKSKGVNVTAEVTPHHLTLTEEAVIDAGTAAKVNPPLRTSADIDALIEGLKEGVIDAIATDHAPHTRADKTCDFEKAAFGISGFETALGSLISLVDSGAIDLLTLISKLTIEPARIVATHQVTGSLKVGSLADITIFDPDAEWWVDPEGFVSKGKNTPLAGSVLTGKVMATIASGKLIYES